MRSVAFLRAVNVGGRTVTMAALVRLFGKMGFEHAQTFLASGNVIFEAPATSRDDLERRVQSALSRALKYDVPVFVRTMPEIAAIAAYEAFDAADVASAEAFNVAFTASPLDRAERARVAALATDLDRFHVHGAEVYWLCRVRQSQSTFNNAGLEKALGRRATIRGLNTLRRLAQRYAE